MTRPAKTARITRPAESDAVRKRPTMSQDMEELDVLSQLLVEEKDVIKGLAGMVERAKKVFLIEHPTGRIIFQDFGNLTDERRILTLLLGKYFASRLGLVAPELSISEIAHELGRPKTTLSGAVKACIDRGLVEKLPTRTYRIAYNRIRDVFAIILPEEKPKPKLLNTSPSLIDTIRGIQEKPAEASG
jgi:hypothetical protein